MTTSIDYNQVASSLSMIPGMIMCIKWIYKLSHPHGPLSYLLVCILTLLYHGTAAFYHKNIRLLKSVMISQNMACVVTMPNSSLLYIFAFLIGINLSLDLRNKNELVASYVVNALITILSTSVNAHIFSAWIRIFLVFALSVKYHHSLFQIAYHIMTHCVIDEIWHLTSRP